MREKNIKKLEECEERLNNIIVEMESILKEEKAYKAFLYNSSEDYERYIIRSEDVCTFLYRSIHNLTRTLEEINDFSQFGIIR